MKIRRRRGQILFLEYTGLLPIFFMFFLVSISFHVWYEHVREAYAHSHFAATRRIDNHWMDGQENTGTHNSQDQVIFNAVKENGGQMYEDGRLDRVDGLAAGDDPAINHLVVKRYGAVSVRNVQLPRMGQAAPVGLGYASRDPWSHRDITDQTGQAVTEAQPYIFFEPAASGDLPKQFLRL